MSNLSNLVHGDGTTEGAIGTIGTILLSIPAWLPDTEVWLRLASLCLSVIAGILTVYLLIKKIKSFNQKRKQ